MRCITRNKFDELAYDLRVDTPPVSNSPDLISIVKSSICALNVHWRLLGTRVPARNQENKARCSVSSLI